MSLQFVRESAMPAASPIAPLAMLVRAPEPEEEEEEGAGLTALNSARQAAASRRAVMVTVQWGSYKTRVQQGTETGLYAIHFYWS